MTDTASLSVSIPRLRSARLTLREYQPGDFDAYAANMADPETTKFIGPSDRRNAWRLFLAGMGYWVLGGAGWWALELRETGEVVGNVGAFFREGNTEIELGWNTYRPFWGKGYATEAATEVARHCFEARGEKRVYALIDAANVASLRVAARLGLRHEADVELFGTPVGKYARLP